MKRLIFQYGLILILLFSALLFAAPVFAGPFLACDPTEQTELATKSQVEFDGTWEAAVDIDICTDKAVGCIYTNAAGVKSYILRDLAGITDGSHTVRARFANEWGDGEISDPFVFVKKRPGKKSLRLIP